MNDDLSHQMQLAGELGVTEARLEAALRRIAELEAERDAYKWGYEYLQHRMHSIDRHGWATDCDDEIAARTDAARAALKEKQP
jgi:hypothetical protein